jgi:hypothetical protein
MKPDKEYITQVTAKDLHEIALAANLSAGVGIHVQRAGDALEISIPQEAFKRMVYTFCRQAWPNVCVQISENTFNSIDLRK